MPKFTLICEHDGDHCPSKNTLEFDAIFLDDVLEGFRQFLKGCTFEFSGNLEIVDVDYHRKIEPEPEYEEDVGSKVFDSMAANLMANPITETTTTTNDKCKVCGLPVSIMERSVCYDANCGLLK